ncbi:MAG TPA: TIGR03435 family protein [Terriglobus sp.]
MRSGFLSVALGIGYVFTANAQTAQVSVANAVRFDVASIRPDDEPFKPPSFALSADDSFRDPRGRFHADFALPTYIQFAYKLWLTDEERKDMLSSLPEWVAKQRFDIEATAPEHATKEQYRQMMQTLLAERFGLTLHFEKKDRPVLAMVLVKPGIPGPKLVPHDKGQPCEEKPTADTFPGVCYMFAAHMDKSGMWLSGSRATTMDLLGNFVASLAGSSGEISRRVVDKTGLTGLWDFTMLAPAPVKVQTADAQSETTALEALRDQLGIKLKPDHAIVSLPVIDHIQKPEEN